MSMAATCEEVLSTNMTYWIMKNVTSMPPPEIGEITCPGLCSGQGTCRNGTCICNPGFISADCSINATKGPNVTSIVSGGLCDIRKQRDCSKVRVIGSDFMDSDDLSCRAIEIDDQQVIVSNYLKIIILKVGGRSLFQGYIVYNIYPCFCRDTLRSLIEFLSDM